MGYWVGNEHKRFFIEGGVVLSGPNGKPLAIDPVTLKPIAEAPAYVPAPEVVEPEAKNVLKDFTDENKVDAFIKDGRAVKEFKHSKDCTSMGRGGKYTEGCLKCASLKGK